jgi:hypothetical protein
MHLNAPIPLLVDAMEQHGHLYLIPIVKLKLTQISTVTIDRMLADARVHIDGQHKRLLQTTRSRSDSLKGLQEHTSVGGAEERPYRASIGRLWPAEQH